MFPPPLAVCGGSNEDGEWGSESIALAEEGDLAPEEAILEFWRIYFILFYFILVRKNSPGKGGQDDPRWQQRQRADLPRHPVSSLGLRSSQGPFSL